MNIGNQPVFLKKFIEIYRKHTCLWKMSDVNYTNKALRREAYEELLKLYRTVDDEAGIDSVKYKINNLRSAFRKEFKIVRQAMGDSTVDYTPSLWYYSSLLFLVENELDCNKDKIDFSYYSDNEFDDVELANPVLAEASTISPTPIIPSRAPKRKRLNSMLEKVHEVLNTTNNEFQTVGANVSWKLQRMKEKQRNTAEHLINTILYYGITNKLNDASTVVLQPPRD